MPLAILPTKSLQHCQDQMIRANEKCKKIFWGNAIGNVAKQKSAALSRADDSGPCLSWNNNPQVSACKATQFAKFQDG